MATNQPIAKSPAQTAEAQRPTLTGTSLGLAVGILAGLSATPVAPVVIGAATALMLPVMGLRQKDSAGQLDHRVVTAFSVALVLGVSMGIATRTHNLLGAKQEDPTSVSALVKEYEAAGFTASQARRAAFRERVAEAGGSRDPAETISKDSVWYADEEVHGVDQASEADACLLIAKPEALGGPDLDALAQQVGDGALARCLASPEAVRSECLGWAAQYCRWRIADTP